MTYEQKQAVAAILETTSKSGLDAIIIHAAINILSWPWPTEAAEIARCQELRKISSASVTREAHEEAFAVERRFRAINPPLGLSYAEVIDAYFERAAE